MSNLTFFDTNSATGIACVGRYFGSCRIRAMSLTGTPVMPETRSTTASPWAPSSLGVMRTSRLSWFPTRTTRWFGVLVASRISPRIGSV
jgi:hypothetical protein